MTVGNRTHWKKTFNRDYLGSHDLDEGKDLIATIKFTVVKGVKDPNGNESPCNVAVFVEDIKPMILNVTACKQIKGFTGSNYIEDWCGVPIQIYVQDGIKAFGSVTEGLRIRSKQPVIDKPKLTKGCAKWNDAINALKNDTPMTLITKHYSVTPSDMETLKNEAGLS